MQHLTLARVGKSAILQYNRSGLHSSRLLSSVVGLTRVVSRDIANHIQLPLAQHETLHQRSIC